MTKTIQAVAFALSVLVTFGTVAGANGLASKQYAAAERVAASDAAVGRMDAQRVIVVGHRATA